MYRRQVIAPCETGMSRRGSNLKPLRGLHEIFPGRKGILVCTPQTSSVEYESQDKELRGLRTSHFAMSMQDIKLERYVRIAVAVDLVDPRSDGSALAQAIRRVLAE
jgi:hypothetical protein